jgi:hypothetical protein
VPLNTMPDSQYTRGTMQVPVASRTRPEGHGSISHDVPLNLAPSSQYTRDGVQAPDAASCTRPDPHLDLEHAVPLNTNPAGQNTGGTLHWVDPGTDCTVPGLHTTVAHAVPLNTVPGPQYTAGGAHLPDCGSIMVPATGHACCLVHAVPLKVMPGPQYRAGGMHTPVTGSITVPGVEHDVGAQAVPLKAIPGAQYTGTGCGAWTTWAHAVPLNVVPGAQYTAGATQDLVAGSRTRPDPHSTCTHVEPTNTWPAAQKIRGTGTQAPVTGSRVWVLLHLVSRLSCMLAHAWPSNLEPGAQYSRCRVHLLSMGSYMRPGWHSPAPVGVDVTARAHGGEGAANVRAAASAKSPTTTIPPAALAVKTPASSMLNGIVSRPAEPVGVGGAHRGQDWG